MNFRGLSKEQSQQQRSIKMPFGDSSSQVFELQIGLHRSPILLSFFPLTASLYVRTPLFYSVVCTVCVSISNVGQRWNVNDIFIQVLYCIRTAQAQYFAVKHKVISLNITHCEFNIATIMFLATCTAHRSVYQ